MITERTLRKWRADALKFKMDIQKTTTPSPIVVELCNRILKLTQELLDQYLIGRGQ